MAIGELNASVVNGLTLNDGGWARLSASIVENQDAVAATGSPSISASHTPAAEFHAYDHARPDGDVTAGSWLPSAGSALYAMVNEVEPDDSTYIYGQGDACTVSLGNIADPGPGAVHRVRCRAACPTGGGWLALTLYQGATSIASLSWIGTITPTFQEIGFDLTAAQADAITDYTDLRIQFWTIVSGPVHVSWSELAIGEYTEASNTLAAAASSTVAGSSTTTQAGDALSAAAAATIAGALVASQDADTASTSASPSVAGTLTAQQAGDVVAASASSSLQASAALAQAGQSSAASASSFVVAALDAANDGDVLAASGSPSVTAGAGLNAGSDTIISSAASLVEAVLAAVARGDTLAALYKVRGVLPHQHVAAGIEGHGGGAGAEPHGANVVALPHTQAAGITRHTGTGALTGQ